MADKKNKTDEKKLDPLGLLPFAKPITIADVQYTHFQLRKPEVSHMFQAELDATVAGGGVNTLLRFAGEMMVQQLIKVSNDAGESFDGPFSLNMLQNWGIKNYNRLRATQEAIDQLGEDTQS